MVEFETKLREDKDYLLKIIENAKVFKIEGKSFYYYKYKLTNNILFFGRKLPISHIEELRSKYNNYELFLFDKKPSIKSNKP